mmetsp:Transcript_10381/g.20604  ORF Transcript_10381/g.20604 Transcript_10381/m.20604 type:complete len:221 (+) Transcript_10381:436-1098(+)
MIVQRQIQKGHRRTKRRRELRQQQRKPLLENQTRRQKMLQRQRRQRQHPVAMTTKEELLLPLFWQAKTLTLSLRLLLLLQTLMLVARMQLLARPTQLSILLLRRLLQLPNPTGRMSIHLRKRRRSKPRVRVSRERNKPQDRRLTRRRRQGVRGTRKRKTQRLLRLCPLTIGLCSREACIINGREASCEEARQRRCVTERRSSGFCFTRWVYVGPAARRDK